MMDKNKCAGIPVLAVIFAASLLVSCGGEDGFTKAMMALSGKTGQQEGLPPATVEELKKAISEYRSVVDEKVNAAKRIGYLYKMLAIKYIEQKNYGLALEGLMKAIETEPENPNLYSLAGSCAAYVAKSKIGLDGHDPEEVRNSYFLASEAAYKRAIEIDPKSWKSLYGISVLYVFELDRAPEAEPYLKAFLASQTQDIEGRFLLARVWYEKGMYREAIGLYDEIIKISKLEVRRKEAEKGKAMLMELIGEGSK